MTESLLDTPAPKVDPSKNYVEELVGDGKKFKTIEDLARGKYEADLFIESKNRQFDVLAEDYKKLRDEYNAVPKLQELIDRLGAAKDDTSSRTNTLPNEDINREPAFDPSKIDSMLEEKLLKMEAAKRAQENWNTVKEKLHATYGERYPEMLASQTQKLGLTKDKVDELARTAPAAFMQLMGLNDQPRPENFQSPPRASQTTMFAPAVKTRKWSDWKALAKTQPNLFSDPKSHNQMLEDIKAIGEANFYDVD